MTIWTILLLGALDYGSARDHLEAERTQLARQLRGAPQLEQPHVLKRARAVVERAVVHELLPAWLGTPWDFNGTSQTPGEGMIACGYLVSTVLLHAGFRVQRVRLARQAAEHIILSLVPAAHVHRYSNYSVAQVVAAVAALGDGVYVVGLDYHVGFLSVEGGEVTFCHSSYLPPGHVVCSAAEGDAAMVSGYTVVGRLFGEPMMRAWLESERIPTVTGG